MRILVINPNTTASMTRKIGMAAFDRFIEPVGQFALARQRAVPFAIVIGKTADLPLRQLQIDQRQRRIGPGA